MYQLLFKRLIDIIGSFFGLVLLFPVLMIAVFIILITISKKPFFYQKRPGKDERIFSIIKLKTMKDLKDENSNLLEDHLRLNFFGSLIRKLSIDEIPQLINVIKGEMSLVGPRPLLESYLPLYNSFQRKRHLIRPGITGWAQVNGRNSLSWKDKFELDVWYVENLSFLLDIKIILLTMKKVFIREGVNQTEKVTMVHFKGN
jgi:undecaprenyl phosphate N,N'-diacetylbacillosamine 1-phosphate transferase